MQMLNTAQIGLALPVSTSYDSWNKKIHRENKAQQLDRSFQSGSLNILSHVSCRWPRHQENTKELTKLTKSSKGWSPKSLTWTSSLKKAHPGRCTGDTKKIKKHTRLAPLCHMVNSESPIKSWNFAWVPQKMTHIMGNSQVHGDQTLVPTWKKWSGFTPRLIKYDGTTKKLIQSILEKWCVSFQSVSRVSLQILYQQHTKSWNKLLERKKSPVKLKISLERTIFLSLMTSLYKVPYPEHLGLTTSGSGPDLKRKIPVQTAKSTGPESQHPMTWANMDFTWLFIQLAVSGWQQEMEMPSWFVKILDTISKWGPKYICIEHTTIWHSRIFQGASVPGDSCVFSRATHGITNCQVLFSFTWPSWPMDAHGSILSPKGTTIFSLPLSISVSLLPTPSIWFSSLIKEDMFYWIALIYTWWKKSGQPPGMQKAL